MTDVGPRGRSGRRNIRGTDAAAAQQIVAGCREELARADGKASLLIGITAGALGLVGPAARAEGDNSGIGPLEVLGAAGVVMWAAALIAFTVAVFPRLRSGHPSSLAYFTRIAGLKRTVSLHAYVRSIAATPLPHLLIQARDLSRIVTVKYRSIQAGIWLLLTGGLFEIAFLCLR